MLSKLTTKMVRNKNKKHLEGTLGKAPSTKNNDSIDLSHVRKPIDTSVFGLSHVLSLFETATDEVRRYVAYECDVMYECRICKTIFRSLANFILHKRNYCREKYSPSSNLNCKNTSQMNEVKIIKEDGSSNSSPEKEENSVIENNTVEKSHPNKLLNTQTKEKKNLNSVLNLLHKEQQYNNSLKSNYLPNNFAEDSTSSCEEQTKSNVALQKIENNPGGFYQTMFKNLLSKNGTIDFMKSEVMEIHSILEDNEAIIGSDGKILSFKSEKNSDHENNLICTTCNQMFSTKKTLTYHMNYKHNKAKVFYKCPECADTFANTWGVFRHLYKIHRKSTAQVKRLRNQIHANKFKKNNQPEHKERIPKITPESTNTMASDDMEWMSNLEKDNDLQRCAGCGRKYERKAALHSHSLFCSKRVTCTKENNTKKMQNEDKQEKIISEESLAKDRPAKRLSRRKPLFSQKIIKPNYLDGFLAALEKDKVTSKSVDKDDKENISNSDEQTTISSENFNNLEKINSSEDDTVFQETEFIDSNKICANSSNTLLNSNDPNYNTLVSSNINDSDNCGSSILSNDEIDNVYNSIDNELNTSFLKLTVNKSESKIETPISSSDYNICISTCNDILDNDVQPNLNHEDSTNNNKRKVEVVDNTFEDLLLKRKKKDRDISEKHNLQSFSNIHCYFTSQCRNYIDGKRRTCIKCKLHFRSQKLLMKHMALHFNWNRYKCKNCEFISYTKKDCSRHIIKHHDVTSKSIAKMNIVHIPFWKILNLSTDFKELTTNNIINKTDMCSTLIDKSYLHTDIKIEKDELDMEETNFDENSNTSEMTLDFNKVKVENVEIVGDDDEELESLESVMDSINENCSVPNMHDPAFRKKIMEVIVGSDIFSSDFSDIKTESIISSTEASGIQTNTFVIEEPQCSSTHQSVVPEMNSVMLRDSGRPIRNRIVPVQKDFLYDAKHMLKASNEKDKNVHNVDSKNNYLEKHKPLKIYINKSKLECSNIKNFVGYNLNDQIQPETNLINTQSDETISINPYTTIKEEID